MAVPRESGAGGGTNASRLSLASDAPSQATATDASAANASRTALSVPPELMRGAQAAQARYPIHAVLAEPKAAGSLLPTLPVLPSASSYLPSQLSSLSTTFTSAGTLPRSSSGKSVAQRRSQAPPIQVSELRKVPRSDFDGYLTEIRGEYERWQNEVAAAAAAEAEQQEGHETGPGGEEVLPPLDDIPRIFFDSAFNLSNPRTFDLVTERIQLTPSGSPNLLNLSSAFGPPRASSDAPRPSFDHIQGLGPETLQDLAADEKLQDKLSHYTAVIESHLVREIGLRSSSFFAALSNLQSLHQQGQDALGKIAELQGTLGRNRGGVGSTAKHGLQILQAQARRRGLERIEESVRAVEEIWTAVEGVKELVENGEWDGALEVSEEIESAYYAGSQSPHTANGDGRPPLPHPASSSSATFHVASTSRRAHPGRRPLNLTKLRALASLPSKLALLRAQIAKSLQGELVTVLEHELDAGIDEYVKTSKAGQRWKGKERAREVPPEPSTQALASVREEDDGESGPAAADGGAGELPADRAHERISERIRPVVRALVRADGMDSAVASWRESVLREIRALVREHLPTSDAPALDDDDSFAQAAIRSVSKQSVDLGVISEKSLSLAKKLRALSHEEFVDMAQSTYLGLLACIEIVDLQARILVDEWQANRKIESNRRSRRRGLASGDGAESPGGSANGHLTVPGGSLAPSRPPDGAQNADLRSTTSEDSATLATEITDVVHAVAELANVRFSKVIGVRTEVHAQLALAGFVQIFDLSWDFVVQCERICQRMIVGLRGAMVAQAKTFLQAFHQRKITENARVVEEEQWAAVEVGPEVQNHVALIVQIAMSDPTELLIGARRPAAVEGTSNSTPAAENGEAAKDPPAGMSKQIDVEGKQFFAVSAVLTTIAALMDYLKVLVNVPMLTTDVMSKLIEFMKVFNSRTCQVVLGAGAMRSAGLKNITAKHLALASQALSIMVSLVSYIREGVRRHLNQKQAVMLTEFDKLKRDYQEHQHEIHAKLIAIMSDRLHVHSRTLESIRWEEPPPQEGAPNPYMESLVKEHTTLHKVLSRFLHAETVMHIMTQVFAALDAKLAEQFGKVELKSQRAQERMLVDVRYLSEKLGSLKGLENIGPGKTLETLVANKSVPRPGPPSPRIAPSSPSMPSSPTILPSPKINPPTRSSSRLSYREAPPSPGAPHPSQDSRPASASLAAPDQAQDEHATAASPTEPPASAGSRGASSEPQRTEDAHKSEADAAIPDAPAPTAPTATPTAMPPSAARSPPTSPTLPPSSPAKKRKTLAERLVESMGRRVHIGSPTPTAPTSGEARRSFEKAEPAPDQAPASAEPSTVSTQASAESASSQQSGKVAASPDPARPSAEQATPGDISEAQAVGIAQNDLDTPTLEKTLALELSENNAPLATPTMEELDAAEKEIGATASAPSEAAAEKLADGELPEQNGAAAEAEPTIAPADAVDSIEASSIGAPDADAAPADGPPLEDPTPETATTEGLSAEASSSPAEIQASTAAATDDADAELATEPPNPGDTESSVLAPESAAAETTEKSETAETTKLSDSAPVESQDTQVTSAAPTEPEPVVEQDSSSILPRSSDETSSLADRDAEGQSASQPSKDLPASATPTGEDHAAGSSRDEQGERQSVPPEPLEVTPTPAEDAAPAAQPEHIAGSEAVSVTEPAEPEGVPILSVTADSEVAPVSSAVADSEAKPASPVVDPPTPAEADPTAPGTDAERPQPQGSEPPALNGLDTLAPIDTQQTSTPPFSPSPTSPPVTANGTRKKTLKERLEEAARRRGSPTALDAAKRLDAGPAPSVGQPSPSDLAPATPSAPSPNYTATGPDVGDSGGSEAKPPSPANDTEATASKAKEQ